MAVAAVHRATAGVTAGVPYGLSLSPLGDGFQHRPLYYYRGGRHRPWPPCTGSLLVSLPVPRMFFLCHPPWFWLSTPPSILGPRQHRPWPRRARCTAGAPLVPRMFFLSPPFCFFAISNYKQAPATSLKNLPVNSYISYELNRVVSFGPKLKEHGVLSFCAFCTELCLGALLVLVLACYCSIVTELCLRPAADAISGSPVARRGFMYFSLSLSFSLSLALSLSLLSSSGTWEVGLRTTNPLVARKLS